MTEDSYGSYGEWVKANARRLKVKIKELLALSPSVDPFYLEMPSQRIGAEWAASLYRRWASERTATQLHVRRLHYYLLSLVGLQRPTSTATAYENTTACWNYLVRAVVNARYMNLIPMRVIVDRKNVAERHAHYWEHEDFDEKITGISVESIADTIADDFNIYNNQLVQPYHLEIWIEKGTMNDVIDPIARQYGIDVVIGEGEISLTQVYKAMAKIARINKPVRIFYISDLDPVGEVMPISISRKMEWFHKVSGYGGLDIKLKQLMLTREQCEDFSLPRAPIKRAEGTGTGARAYETRTRSFEARKGQGATELDALEGLYPGEMERIVEEAVQPYYNEEVTQIIREQNRTMINAVREAILANEDELREAIANMDFQEPLNLCEEFEIPSLDADVQEGDEWLFDSSLNYGEQLQSYRRFKRG